MFGLILHLGLGLELLDMECRVGCSIQCAKSMFWVRAGPRTLHSFPWLELTAPQLLPRDYEYCLEGFISFMFRDLFLDVGV